MNREDVERLVDEQTTLAAARREARSAVARLTVDLTRGGLGTHLTDAGYNAWQRTWKPTGRLTTL